ncbi:class I SAM-dependent methyltransferase [Scatolibacter rhodanostii]|uniref:class I SAM-dependent methyltransferase n=1 Tax=Scatolibacter rhodanostii TaxID=2014781 RepID=UPI000C078356|nr:class I SAM-dependent methyltransferase [Scatolibacter rhodanostii]
MSENINIGGYLDTVNAPWGKLFYKLVWRNINCQDKKILDFGSGFGLTANHLAKKNDVTAIEPNEEMLVHQLRENQYQQLIGSIEKLEKMPNQSFDVIICHNVLEYFSERDRLFNEFYRLLSPEGFLSVVKHNKTGKIMQKAVFEYNVGEALDLIHHGDAVSTNFGTINEYEDYELGEYNQGSFCIEKVYGIRTFFALQRNELKIEPDWLSNMYQLESAVEEIPTFRDIAFFHHVILKPKTQCF